MMNDHDPQQTLVESLERRIDEIDSLDESSFGAFSSVDWILCVVGAVILPLLAVIWFAV